MTTHTTVALGGLHSVQLRRGTHKTQSLCGLCTPLLLRLLLWLLRYASPTPTPPSPTCASIAPRVLSFILSSAEMGLGNTAGDTSSELPISHHPAHSTSSSTNDGCMKG
eukprot:CAMPEP_0179456610 /NCGR_PEP_ID=MMETSP0799-20121207/40498_1 /TAXON_ID=46947 /ORGANISM="Geminigera cryophila, Strain CCMP2564" /LENGTH=108 /DNA_ID=CAMNT_0021256709 /DNA_START=549 /DNA_END=875 /DNA_ORIENTATION=-